MRPTIHGTPHRTIGAQRRSALRDVRVTLVLAGIALVTITPRPADAQLCTTPTSLSGPLRDLAPSRAQADAGFVAYQRCVSAIGSRIEANPRAVMAEVAQADRRANTVIRLVNSVLPVDIVEATGFVFRSNIYKPEIMSAVRVRSEAFGRAYTAAQQPDAATVETALQLSDEWGALRAEFRKMLELTTDPEMVEQLQDAIEEGDRLTRNLSYIVLDNAVRRGALPADRLAATLQRLGVDVSTLGTVVRQDIAQMRAALEEHQQQAAKSATAAANHRRAVQTIGEYALVADGMLGLAAHAGVLPPRDAATMRQVVGGAAQIATAAVILSDPTVGTAATVAGPYGMAIAGGLAIVGALQKPGASEGQVIMGMLREISEQLTQLQRSVDFGFQGVQVALQESERRLMRQLSVIVQRTDLLIEQSEQLRQDLVRLREELVAQAESERLQANEAFLRKVALRDGRCLKSFQSTEAGERTECYRHYSALVDEFITTANAKFVGVESARLSDRVAPDDQLAALAAAAGRYAPLPPARNAVHGPTLDLLTDRVRLFLVLNDSVRSQPDVRDLVTRLDRLAAGRRALLTALANDSTRVRAQRAYAAEVTRLLEAADKRASAYIETVVVTDTDELHRTQVQILTDPSSLAAQHNHFAAPPASATPQAVGSQRSIAARIGSAPPALLTLGAAATRFRAHATVHEKLANYGRAVLERDSADYLAFPEAQRGMLWVAPCAGSEFLPFPVRRAALAEVLPAAVVALSSVGKGLFSLCYRPRLDTLSGRHINNDNTNGGMPTVVARLASVGFQKGSPVVAPSFGPGPGIRKHAVSTYDAFCYQRGGAGAYFNRTYVVEREFPGSAWEKCHHGHFHHKLYTASRQIMDVTFEAELNLPAYRSARRRFAITVDYPQGAIDRCLLPLTTSGRWHGGSVFAPFLYEYPLPVTKACPGVDAQLALAAPALRAAIDDYLDQTTTRRDGNPQAPTLRMRQAVDSAVAERREAFYGQYVATVVGPTSDLQPLDQLYALIASLDQLRPDSGAVAPSAPGDSLPGTLAPRTMSSAGLRALLTLTLRDPATRTVRTASSLAPFVLEERRHAEDLPAVPRAVADRSASAPAVDVVLPRISAPSP
jgi:hypothetical protein